jgi:hypothetical protein
MWNLDEGIKLVRALQPGTRKFGYHLTIGGSVVNEGKSEKDIDLYFHPMQNKDFKEDTVGLIDWLEGMWGKANPIAKVYAEDESPFDDLLKNYRYDLRRRADGQWEKIAVPIAPTFKIEPQEQCIYKHKLKFFRVGGERIDTFIL